MTVCVNIGDRFVRIFSYLIRLAPSKKQKMMKLGIIGGIGPESTIEYYRLIIKLFKERSSNNYYPEILLQSINMTAMLDFVFSEKLDGLVFFLKKHVQILENAGVDFAVLASNTPHLVFDQLADSVNIPMISIVEETCKLISEKGLAKVGLLGTKSTMSKGFYQEKGLEYGVKIISPKEEIQNYVHEKYMDELVFNQIIPENKKKID